MSARIPSVAEYVEGTGVVQQVKEVVKVSHRSLSDSLQDPELLLSDLAKLDAPGMLHVGWLAVNAFHTQRGRWPEAWSAGIVGERRERREREEKDREAEESSRK